MFKVQMTVFYGGTETVATFCKKEDAESYKTKRESAFDMYTSFEVIISDKDN